MNVSAEFLFQLIGRLHVENLLLREALVKTSATLSHDKPVREGTPEDQQMDDPRSSVARHDESA
jgi:hypothetical protein